MTDQETLLDTQNAQLDTIRRLDEVNAQALDSLDRANVTNTSTSGLLARMGAMAAQNPPPEPPTINLTARRQELFEAHAAVLHQQHYLEGALNEIDYLLELTNPHPADTAEGALT